MKILSLGAGVQSSTLFLMSCYGELEKVDHAIFSDTGWEPGAVYRWFEFLKSEGEKHGIPVHVVSQGNVKADALRYQVPHQGGEEKKGRWGSMPFFTLEDGKKGMIRRQCTYEYKIRPLERKQRELAGYQPRQRIPPGTVELWKGISVDEMQRATLSPTKWISFYYPLIELGMSRHDCLCWFDDKGLARPPRSACLGCPYKSNREWIKLRNESAGEWADVVMFDKAIRKCGGLRGNTYLHADRVPLDEVDLSTAEDHGQLNLFRDDCMGMCGV